MTQQNTEMAVLAMVEAGRVAAHTDELMGELAPLFARVEPRRTCRDYVQALMGGLPRANCWTLAEAAGHAGPGRMQHLLERASWDTSAALEAVGGFVTGKLADPQAVLVFDLCRTGNYADLAPAGGSRSFAVVGSARW